MAPSLQWRDRKDNLVSRSFGEDIKFGKRSDAGTGYLAHSDRVGPGVVLLHEFFGLTQSFRDYADGLNREGFTVLVPDLYDGAIAEDPTEAEAMADSLDTERTMLQLRAACEHLTANWHPRLALVGFSLGASLSVPLAREVDTEALVLYYGMHEGVDLDGWRVPVLGHFAEQDEWTPRPEAEAWFARLEASGADAEMHVYPGTGHWFANPDVPEAFDEAAAEAAWGRTVEFLRYHAA